MLFTTAKNGDMFEIEYNGNIMEGIFLQRDGGYKCSFTILIYDNSYIGLGFFNEKGESTSKLKMKIISKIEPRKPLRNLSYEFYFSKYELEDYYLRKEYKIERNYVEIPILIPITNKYICDEDCPGIDINSYSIPFCRIFKDTLARYRCSNILLRCVKCKDYVNEIEKDMK